LSKLLSRSELSLVTASYPG